MIAQLVLLGGYVLIGVILVFFFSLFYSTARSAIAGAPFVPMTAGVVALLLEMLHLGAGDTLVDLGCGDGRVMDAALKLGAGTTIGYDVAWWPLFLARRRLEHWGDKARLIRQDARSAGLGEATAVYMYLLPGIVDRLAPYLADKLRPGTRVLSAAFPINVNVHTGFRLLEERKAGTFTGFLYEKI